ncbi:hypothetical protein CI238_02126, partial [Colletotrichum incanum]
LPCCNDAGACRTSNTSSCVPRFKLIPGAKEVSYVPFVPSDTGEFDKSIRSLSPKDYDMQPGSLCGISSLMCLLVRIVEASECWQSDAQSALDDSIGSCHRPSPTLVLDRPQPSALDPSSHVVPSTTPTALQVSISPGRSHIQSILYVSLKFQTSPFPQTQPRIRLTMKHLASFACSSSASEPSAVPLDSGYGISSRLPSHMAPTSRSRCPSGGRLMATLWASACGIRRSTLAVIESQCRS